MRIIRYIKHNFAVRHIPIYLLTTQKTAITTRNNMNEYIIQTIQKPIDSRVFQQITAEIKNFKKQSVKKILLIHNEDDYPSEHIINLFNGNANFIIVKSTIKDAIRKLSKEPYAALILSISLADVVNYKLFEKITRDKQLQNQVILICRRDLSVDETKYFNKFANDLRITWVNTNAQLLDKVNLLLHQPFKQLPDHSQKLLRDLYQQNDLFIGKKVLIIDDDVRNTFALTSTLEDYQLKVIVAKDGNNIFETLQKHQNLNAILMDIMLPEIDGYEVISQIRQAEQYKDLPIIAVTAKAMRYDREKCLAVGASDYIPKPIKIDDLLSMLRLWMY